MCTLLMSEGEFDTVAGIEAAQEVVQNILDVVLRTPPPVSRDEWSEGGLRSWCGAAEVRCCVLCHAAFLQTVHS